MSNTPRRRWFQFGLRTMFVVVAIVACSVVATQSGGLVVGGGLALLMTGYWLLIAFPPPAAEVRPFGWLAILAGLSAILLGGISGAVE